MFKLLYEKTWWSAMLDFQYVKRLWEHNGGRFMVEKVMFNMEEETFDWGWKADVLLSVLVLRFVQSTRTIVLQVTIWLGWSYVPFWPGQFCFFRVYVFPVVFVFFFFVLAHPLMNRIQFSTTKLIKVKSKNDFQLGVNF